VIAFTPSDLFGSSPGIVGMSTLTKATPILIFMGGEDEDSPELTVREYLAAVTSVDFEASSGLSVTHSFGDAIRFYTFSERVMPCMLRGVLFAGLCEQSVNDETTGVDGILEYYEKVRASSRRVPIRVRLGKFSEFRGMVEKLTVQFSKPEMAMFDFAMTIQLIPRVTPRRRFIPPVVVSDEESTGGGGDWGADDPWGTGPDHIELLTGELIR